jgi:excisionase family DNA binding protein
MRNEDLAARHRAGDHPQQQPQTLTVAEAAQVCGVSTSTIRRYLRGGRFPGARQDPSPVPGQPGHWRIPTDDLVQAGLEQQPTPSRHAEQQHVPADRAAASTDSDRVQALERALELERSRRQAAEVLAAERARTILTLETALRAVEHRRPEQAADQAATTTAASSRSGGGQVPATGRPPGLLQMVPRPRRSKGELTPEERAAIIGRALNRERPPKRRWAWW